jgi:hypothetical protein
VVDHFELFSDAHWLDLIFIKVAQDWVADAFASFFNLLYSFTLRCVGKDKLCRAPFQERIV